jgi:23S rRNA-/tRNA-specific pseudouridylate synthase
VGRSVRQSEYDVDFTAMHAHRLDMATGGVLVAAKTRSALTALCAAFEQRLVTKRYLALVVVSALQICLVRIGRMIEQLTRQFRHAHPIPLTRL